MNMLRAIGYWREEWGPPGTDVWRASPHVILARLGAQAAQPQIASYLRSGHEFEGWRGWSWCRFKCGIDDSRMGDSDLTDGIWVWPQGLVHYVDAHHLALPREFVEHVLVHKGVVPPLPAEIRAMTDAEKLTSVDPGFWNEWYAEVVGEAG